jgi:hypothetical protein
VRWGNAAAAQRQHDVFGEILDCAWQWANHHGVIDQTSWQSLRACIESACAEWRAPDQGIRETRAAGQPFTYSAALCQVALDRGARLAERFNLPGDVAGWKIAAEEIRRSILAAAWDEQQQSLTEHLGKGGLDASLLALPLRRVIPADHPRMIATTAAITRRLGAGDGLLYRYLPEESPDGLAGREGAFLLCSFWLVDNLALQGRLDEAMELFDSLCHRTSELGLLPEEIDPATGAFLGNYPQTFSHVGLISSAVNLARALRQRTKEDLSAAMDSAGAANIPSFAIRSDHTRRDCGLTESAPCIIMRSNHQRAGDGRDWSLTGAEGATALETLRQKDRPAFAESGKRSGILLPPWPAEGITLSGKPTDGAINLGCPVALLLRSASPQVRSL